MSLDAFDPSVGLRPSQTHRPQGIRNPANLKLDAHRRHAVAMSLSATASLEALGLAVLITAVASALPLVMMLHQ